MLVLGHVLDEQRPGDDPSLDERLVHAEDVGTPLRFVGHERAGGVQHARRHEPAGAGLQTVGLGVAEDAVVALVPAFQAAADVGLGGAGFQAEEGVREVVTDGVELGWKVIRLRLTLLSDFRSLLVVLVHVVGDRPQVVEELAVDRPPRVTVPDRLADQLRALQRHRLLERKRPLAVDDGVAEPFVRRGAFVRGRRGGSEPALVDAPAVSPQGVNVLRGKFDPPARHQEGARHPRGCQSKEPFAGFERPPHRGGVGLGGRGGRGCGRHAGRSG